MSWLMFSLENPAVKDHLVHDRILHKRFMLLSLPLNLSVSQRSFIWLSLTHYNLWYCLSLFFSKNVCCLFFHIGHLLQILWLWEGTNKQPWKFMDSSSFLCILSTLLYVIHTGLSILTAEIFLLYEISIYHPLKLVCYSRPFSYVQVPVGGNY